MMQLTDLLQNVKLTCSRHDIAEELLELALNNNHSLTHKRR